MARPPDGPVTPHERQDWALELFMAGGRSYAQIAAQSHPNDPERKPLYASAGACRNAVLAAMVRLRGLDVRNAKEATTDERKRLQDARLDRLQRARWADALRGDKDAFTQVMAVMNARADLWGLKVKPANAATDDGEEDSVVDELRERRANRRRGATAPTSPPAAGGTPR